MACSQMFSGIHWSDRQKADDGGFVNQRELLRTRLDKVKFTNQILAYYGLVVSSRPGGGYTVSNRKGRSLLCQDFGDLWLKAQQLSGRAVDPLDPALIARLSQGAVMG